MVSANSYIWLVGGSEMGGPMVEEIKGRGHKLLVTDGNPNCYCREKSDFFHSLSVYDVAAHLNLARSLKNSNGFSVAAILTIGTDAGPTVSALSDEFGLPGIGRKKAELVKDKIEMRQALGLAHPYYFVHNNGQPVGHFQDDKFPMAVKSPAEAGSRGFAIAKNNDELHKIVTGRGGDLLFEQLLIGDDIIPAWRHQYGFDTSEAAYDFFIEDGKVIYANGALRMFWADRPGIEAGHINPFEADERVMGLAQEAATRLGLKWGVLKIDVKRDARYGWCLLECATRLSGGWDHMITSPLATGRDITGAMLDVALGLPLDKKKLENTKKRVACCYAPIFRPGVIDGWEIAGAYNSLFFNKGDIVSDLKTNQDRVAFVVCDGKTANEALRRAMSIEIEPIYLYQEDT